MATYYRTIRAPRIPALRQWARTISGHLPGTAGMTGGTTTSRDDEPDRPDSEAVLWDGGAYRCYTATGALIDGQGS